MEFWGFVKYRSSEEEDGHRNPCKEKDKPWAALQHWANPSFLSLGFRMFQLITLFGVLSISPVPPSHSFLKSTVESINPSSHRAVWIGYLGKYRGCCTSGSRKRLQEFCLCLKNKRECGTTVHIINTQTQVLSYIQLVSLEYLISSLRVKHSQYLKSWCLPLHSHRKIHGKIPRKYMESFPHRSQV